MHAWWYMSLEHACFTMSSTNDIKWCFFVHPEDSKSSFPKPICTQKPSFAAEFLKTTDTNEADPKRRKLETIPKTNPKSGGDNIWLKRLGDYMERFVMLKNIRSSLEQTIPDVVTFQLPALDALSGRVIRHCSTVLEKLFETEAPLTWKIGVTHCPHWRWTNQLYGYKHGREKFKHMLIMYMAPEPFSVGMLEAAMIDKYQSNWTKKTFFMFPLVVFFGESLGCWFWVFALFLLRTTTLDNIQWSNSTIPLPQSTNWLLNTVGTEFIFIEKC